MRPLALILALTLAACASPARMEDMRERAEVAEADAAKTRDYLAGAHEDNAMLQRAIIEYEMALRSLQGGMVLQAMEAAKLREGCDI